MPRVPQASTQPYQVRLDPAVWEQVRQAALADRRTIGAEIGVLCTEALAARQQPPQH